MLTSEDVTTLLCNVARTVIGKYDKKLNLSFDPTLVRNTVDVVEDFINEEMSDFVIDGVNCPKKSSAFELILLKSILINSPESDHDETVKINARFAMSSACALLFDDPFPSIETRKPILIDDKFHDSMSNHYTYLCKLSDFESDVLPVVIVSEYWNLAKMIYDNRQNFSNI